jgi:nicotinate phosphoribosyltransferase
VADGFGVGTSLSNAPTIDFAFDIVEVEGVPFAKRGKRSGRKQLRICPFCGRREVLPAAAEGNVCCGGTMEPLLLPAMRAGRAVAAVATPREIRSRVLRQVERFHAREGSR